MANTMENKVPLWTDEINLYNTRDEEIQQALANPLLHNQLDITSHTVPDHTFAQLPVWNEISSLSQIGDQQLEFEIRRPDPVLISSILFKIYVTVKIAGKKAEDVLKEYFFVSDFFGQMFNCEQINIGQNGCNISHTDTQSDIWHYVRRRLWNRVEYGNYIGRLEGGPYDTAGAYDLNSGAINASNNGGQARMKQLLTSWNDNTNSGCMNGIYVPANLFFEKNKILPPYVPLRIILKKNPTVAYIKSASSGQAAVSVEFTKVTCSFINYKLREGVFEKFRDQYIKNQTRFPPLEMPINPYQNSSAYYEYWDVRAQKINIPSSIENYTTILRQNTTMPKAVVFALTIRRKDSALDNHLTFENDFIKSYSILFNSQPTVSCSVDKITCSSQSADFYLRYRNFLSTYISNDVNGLSYLDFDKGTSIFCELTNNANDLFVPARQEVGTLEIKVSFDDTTFAKLLYVFLIYDQKLLIDNEFNARLITTV